MAEIRLKNVTKKYGDKTILENFSLAVKDGECFSILGPSPCGKTTLLRLICGFERLDDGEISLGGKVVVSKRNHCFLAPEKRNVGMVFQDYAVWPHMTVYENVYYPLKKKGVTKHEAREQTLNALKQVKLGDYIKRLPHQLSGGQQQRVALARALVTSKHVILLDEPLCNLDANLREKMRFEIKELQKQIGTTILYVTHDQEDALAISDRIAVLDKTGKIRQTGIPEKLYKNPVDSYVFKFLGLSNFIPLYIQDNTMFIKDTSPGMAFPYPIPSDIQTQEFFAACRPKEIQLTQDGNLKAVVTRAIFLGNLYEYRIQLGKTEIRVQQDACEALRAGIFKEGTQCGVKFNGIRYYKKIEEV